LQANKSGRDESRRFRERSPRHSRQKKDRDLFADHGDAGNRELFPNKPSSSYIKKELFPTKPSHHRRSDAFDASHVPGSSERRHSNVELFPDSDQGASIRGAAGGAVSAREDQGFAIRGGASQGLSIKGRGSSVRELFPSKYGQDHESGNAGKELFSDKLEGRGGPRRRAEDLFS
jgi:hypothetical protein